MVKRLTERFDPQEIILFGSRRLAMVSKAQNDLRAAAQILKLESDCPTTLCQHVIQATMILLHWQRRVGQSGSRDV